MVFEFPPIKIDSREPGKFQKQCLQHYPNATVEYMDVGDLVCGNVVIERKTIKDFAHSVMNGRVFNQAKNMVNNYGNKSWVFVVGTPDKLRYHPHYKRFTTKNFRGAVGSLEADIGVHVKVFKNHSGFFKYANVIFEKGNREPKDLGQVKRIAPKSADIYVSMLSCLPGIGIKKAENILENFKYNELFEASVEDLCTIKGVGKAQANTVKKFLN